jgi:hypothetical protein
MLKLLACAQGHYWEKPIEGDADESLIVCPVCGLTADMMPLLDLAPTAAEPTVKKLGDEKTPPLRDKDGRPIIAGYEILADLGKSPTGVHLYRARQVLVNRTVLLKVVLAKEDAGQLAWGSLRGEATTLGRLVHANIVQILDAGERERQIFYNAVEQVDGPTLAELLSGKPLPFRQALVLVEMLALAIQHAHGKNNFHRSLKPASILLRKDQGGRNEDDKAGVVSGLSVLLHNASFIPIITDFGLARRPVEGDPVDADLQGDLPRYLAPEQAWGRAKEIGPATDVYALGAILYELICGWPPFRAATAAETLDAIQTREPPPLSRYRSRVPRDVEAICRKCLAKQPRRRYSSALALANDLRRCADGHPVKARTHGAAERLGKLLRRNARAFVLLGLGVALGAALFGLISSDSRPPAPLEDIRKQSERRTLARLEPELLKRRAAADYRRNLALAERELNGGDPARAREWLDGCPVEEHHWEWKYLKSRANGAAVATTFEAKERVTGMDLSRDWRYLLVGATKDASKGPRADRGSVSVWDVATRQSLWQADVQSPVRSVAFQPLSAHFTLLSDNEVQVRTTTGRGAIVAACAFPRGRLTTFSYLPETDRLLVGGGDGALRVLQADWQAGRLREIETLRPAEFGRVRFLGAHARVIPLPPVPYRFAYVCPDGNKVVVLPYLSSVGQFGAGLELRSHFGTVLAVAYDKNGELLATAGSDQTICLWDVHNVDKPAAVLRGHRGSVTGLSFSSDGKRLASCGGDGTVRLWDIEEKLELLKFTGYDNASGVCFWASQVDIGNAFSAEPDRLAVAHGNKVTLLEPR